MDIKVLEVQQWLNKTYSDVSGYERIRENGQSNWETIYGLTMGLQHELGISPVSEGFGNKTKSALSNVVDELAPGYKGNIAKLIQGAFWCKGISPVTFDDKFSDNTRTAFEKLERNAGLDGDGKVSVMLMAALFDMSAFTLIPTENWEDESVRNYHEKIREMQQDLNRRFAVERGLLLPCDGIYQRDTNEELIYYLQKAEGISNANGVYGPYTMQNTPTLSIGSSGDIVKIIQYGLFVNSFYDGDFTGIFDDKLAEGIVKFRKFMKLDPQSSNLADKSLIKSLLTSNGDTERDSIAADTSAQLTEHDVYLLKKYGFSVVGRYLTGSVGVGSNKKDKNLTTEEINLITKEGIKIFPIYQDGGWDEDYFTYEQGVMDAKKAKSAALELGFPKGTNIYFAVDVDIQDGDINSTVVRYFKGINNQMSFYNTCVYGTRNVALHVINHNYAKYAFVSDMSSGYSGNLAFPMPKEWSFDQFVEYSIGNLDIDQVASSGKDEAVSKFGITEEEYATDWAANICNIFAPFKYGNVSLSSDVSKDLQLNENVEMILKLVYGASVGNTKGINIFKLGVKDGKINSTEEIFDKANDIIIGSMNEKISSALNYFASKIENGYIKVLLATKGEKVGLTLSLANSVNLNSQEDFNMGLDITFLINPLKYSKEMLDIIFESLSSGAVALFSGVASTLDEIISLAVDGIKNAMSQENYSENSAYWFAFILLFVFLALAAVA
ncbi:YbfG like protein [Apilactobacillus kunkeei]|nr:YbfG like protein [Apilactobacillus kunkeei]